MACSRVNFTFIQRLVGYHPIYKAEMNFCLFLFVCLYLIQIHISESIWTKLCTHLPLRLEDTVGYVWSENVWPFSTFLTSIVGSECRILGTTWLPAQDTSTTTLYPWFLRVLSVTSLCIRRHLPRVIRGSVISVILTGVSVTSRK